MEPLATKLAYRRKDLLRITENHSTIRQGGTYMTTTQSVDYDKKLKAFYKKYKDFNPREDEEPGKMVIISRIFGFLRKRAANKDEVPEEIYTSEKRDEVLMLASENALVEASLAKYMNLDKWISVNRARAEIDQKEARGYISLLCENIIFSCTNQAVCEALERLPESNNEQEKEILSLFQRAFSMFKKDENGNIVGISGFKKSFAEKEKTHILYNLLITGIAYNAAIDIIKRETKITELSVLKVDLLRTQGAINICNDYIDSFLKKYDIHIDESVLKQAFPDYPLHMPTIAAAQIFDAKRTLKNLQCFYNAQSSDPMEDLLSNG